MEEYNAKHDRLTRVINQMANTTATNNTNSSARTRLGVGSEYNSIIDSLIHSG
jgi:hypothetical protein